MFAGGGGGGRARFRAVVVRGHVDLCPIISHGELCCVPSRPPKLRGFGRVWPNLGQAWPDFWQLSAISVEFGSMLSEIAGSWRRLSLAWSDVGQIWAIPTKFGSIWSKAGPN